MRKGNILFVSFLVFFGACSTTYTYEKSFIYTLRSLIKGDGQQYITQQSIQEVLDTSKLKTVCELDFIKNNYTSQNFYIIEIVEDWDKEIRTQLADPDHSPIVKLNKILPYIYMEYGAFSKPKYPKGYKEESNEYIKDCMKATRLFFDTLPK